MICLLLLKLHTAASLSRFTTCDAARFSAFALTDCAGYVRAGILLRLLGVSLSGLVLGVQILRLLTDLLVPLRFSWSLALILLLSLASCNLCWPMSSSTTACLMHSRHPALCILASVLICAVLHASLESPPRWLYSWVRVLHASWTDFVRFSWIFCSLMLLNPPVYPSSVVPRHSALLLVVLMTPLPLLEINSQLAYVATMANRAWVPVLVDPAHSSCFHLSISVSLWLNTTSHGLAACSSCYSHSAALDVHRWRSSRLRFSVFKHLWRTSALSRWKLRFPSAILSLFLVSLPLTTGSRRKLHELDLSVWSLGHGAVRSGLQHHCVILCHGVVVVCGKTSSTTVRYLSSVSPFAPCAERFARCYMSCVSLLHCCACISTRLHSLWLSAATANCELDTRIVILSLKNAC